MAVSKHRQSASFANLEVTGTLIVNGEVFDGTPVPAQVEAAGSTIVPAQLDRAEFPDRPTVKDVARAYHDLYDALTAAGAIVPRAVPQEAADAPEKAEPEVVEVQAPVAKDEPAQAETAEVV